MCFSLNYFTGGFSQIRFTPKNKLRPITRIQLLLMRKSSLSNTCLARETTKKQPPKRSKITYNSEISWRNQPSKPIWLNQSLRWQERTREREASRRMTAFAPSVKYEPSSFPYGELSDVWTGQSTLRLSVIGDATYARTGTSTQVELARHNEVRYASDEPPTYLMTGSVSSHPKCLFF